MKGNQFYFPVSVTFILISLFTGSCSEEMNPFYVVNDEVRTPVLQILQKSSSTSDRNEGCLELASGANGTLEKWCQQFPVRPEVPLLLRFISLSPSGGNHAIEVVSVSQLTGFNQAALSARIGPGAGLPTREINLSEFAVTEKVELSRILSEAPLRIEERFVSITLPSIDELFAEFQSSGALPGYTLRYRTTNGDLRTDQGFISFFVLPDPESSVFEALASGQFSGGQAPTEETIEALRRAAKTNVPPSLTAFSPDGGSVSSSGETRLELTVGEDPDFDAKSRIQWFISSGELSNMVSRRPVWKPKSSGEVAAFAMIRDLQGGSDFQFRVFDSVSD